MRFGIERKVLKKIKNYKAVETAKTIDYDENGKACVRFTLNKEVEKLKKETAKVKAAEKVIANKKKVQNKFDKLEEKKAALEARKKALKDGKDPEEEKKKAEETIEQKRERLLKSTNPKELYDERDLLSTMELNERINRIDTEARLNSKIVIEHERTGQEKLNEMRSKLDTMTATYKSIDNAYSAVVNSAIGKTLAKKMGLDNVFAFTDKTELTNALLSEIKTGDTLLFKASRGMKLEEVFEKIYEQWDVK